MLLNRIKWIAGGRRLHGFLAVAAAIFVFIFVLSGASHILMVWTGPQQTAFSPPQTSIETNALAAIPAILSAHKLDEAHLIKVVPTERGNALQVTTDEMAPRRYFDLQTHEEWVDYDVQQAIWLARYYTGLQDVDVASVRLQTQFDRQYPQVNRLLPVYRVEFDSADSRVAFVYTEIAVLGNLTNDWKTLLQTVFTNVHTISWLDNVELARVVLMSVMLLSMLGMLLSGVTLLLMMKRRTIADVSRRWHRRVAILVSIPLFASVFSGSYHLLQHANAAQTTALRIADRFQLDESIFTADLAWVEHYQGVKLNHVAIVQGADQQLLYRVSLPSETMLHHAEHDHSSRFDGRPTELGAHYYPVQSNQPQALTDAQQAVYLATRHTGFNPDDVTSVSPIFHFSPEYDFRNKRLPVWRVDFADSQRHSLFVDPATGMIVDQNVVKQRFESWSFSSLHKWNFLVPSLGQAGRDVLMTFYLSMVLLLAALGGIQYWKKRRKAL